jgi:hypothetical protein
MLLAEAGLLDPDRDNDVNTGTEQSGVDVPLRPTFPSMTPQKAALLAVHQSMTRSQPPAGQG